MNKLSSAILERFWIAWNETFPGRKVEFDLGLMDMLVDKHNINAEWLLCGTGEMLKATQEPALFKAWLN
jgi:hypothetical protein